MTTHADGLRLRLGRLSRSVLSLLDEAPSKEKARPADAVARAIVVVFTAAVALIVLRAVGVVVAPGPIVSQDFIAAAGTSRVRLEDYPGVLVAESKGWRRGESARVEPKDGPVLAKSEEEKTDAAGFDADVEPAARLIVLTMDRPGSLKRLLASLVAADYGEDHVNLDIWIDCRDGAAVDSQVLEAAREVEWKQGSKVIHKRLENAGLYHQWIYTWNITEETNEVAVILEDDIEVSRAFYQWLRLVRQEYAQDTDVGAFTLQRSTLRPRQIKGVASGPLSIPKEHVVFKYRLLGTWGFAPQRDQWVEFRKWFEEKRRRGEKPYVDKLVTTEWYKMQEKDGFAKTMWSQWWIKFADEKGYFTVTANLPDGSSLAANWREKGMHYSKAKPKMDFPLYEGSSIDSISLPENAICIDWDGREIKPKAPVRQ